MIAAWHDASAAEAPESELVDALSRYQAGPARTLREGRAFLAASPRDHVANISGFGVALHGWIDNADELAGTLSADRGQPAQIYAAALARWGTAADRHIVGNYAAAAVFPDGTLHLARSPWSAPPLYYHLEGGRTIASPLLRVVFAGGAPRTIDRERIIDELAYDWRSLDEQSWYHDILMVPLGASVRIAGGQRQVDRWYAPPKPRSNDDYDEHAAVEQALALLDEAGEKALAWAGKPALALSAGLDSPLVATALLRALPDSGSLPALTFRPDRVWEGRSPPGTMGDETGRVRDFAALHPQLDWQALIGDVGGFDKRARDVFAASEVFAPGLANVAMYHELYETARARGCDSLLTADLGNATFSETGASAYTEYAAQMRLGQLYRLLRDRPADPRPLWRRFASLVALPLMPGRVRRALRKFVHPERGDMVGYLTPLSAEARSAQEARARRRGTESAWSDLIYDRSRGEAVQREWRDADGPGFDVDLAFEQLYGIRKRDVTSYRPLVEFCLSLPSRAFAWDGEQRRLARRMAEARLPAAIARNTLHGQHNVDWHARLTRDRETLLAFLDTAQDHPWLGETLDIARLRELVRDWPERAHGDAFVDAPRMLALPRALLVGRFIGWFENRNDL